MKVITAPEQYERKKDDVFCFLAGGITNCPDWQQEVINELQKANFEHLIVFNPRRENFPINDPNAAKEQIEWEFKYLEQTDIFSMYFCASESDQPICMYELGRNLALMSKRYHSPYDAEHIVVSVEDGYKRAKDVEIQTDLALDRENYVLLHATPNQHACDIAICYAQCYTKFGTGRTTEDFGKELTKIMESGLYVPPSIPDGCKACSNHPSNGGSGICHCTVPYLNGNGVTY